MVDNDHQHKSSSKKQVGLGKLSTSSSMDSLRLVESPSVLSVDNLLNPCMCETKTGTRCPCCTASDDSEAGPIACNMDCQCSRCRCSHDELHSPLSIENLHHLSPTLSSPHSPIDASQTDHHSLTAISQQPQSDTHESSSYNHSQALKPISSFTSNSVLENTHLATHADVPPRKMVLVVKSQP